MSGSERWWSPKGVLRDIIYGKLVLPTGVAITLFVVWLAGGFE